MAMEGKDFKANNKANDRSTVNWSPTKRGAGMAYKSGNSSPHKQSKSTYRPSSSLQPTNSNQNSDTLTDANRRPPHGSLTTTTQLTSTQPIKPSTTTNKLVPTVAATVSQKTSKRQSHLLLQGDQLITQYLSNHLRSVALGPTAPYKPPISLDTLPFSHIDPIKATESDRRTILLDILDLLEESCVGVGYDGGTGSDGTIGRMGEQGEYYEAVLNAKSLIIHLLQLSV